MTAPPGKKPILLLAHMDVVDARREDWTRDPFVLHEERGYFFGRGSADDKFGVASLTATFLRLKAEGFVPTRDLVIAFSGDEETGMLSARDLVTTHRALTDAEFALNDDGGGGKLDETGTPVAYFVQTAEKTYATFELTVTNPGGHSSTPRTDSAIFDLANVLKRLEAHRFPVAINDTTRAYLREMGRLTPGPEGEAMGRLAADPADQAAADELWRHPEVVGITRTTCVPTMLRAGHAENALAQSATVTVNCRIFPGEAVDAVKATLERVADLKDLKITLVGEGLAESGVAPARGRHRGSHRGGARTLSRYPGHPLHGALCHRRPRGAVRRHPDLRRDGAVHEGQRPVRARPRRARARGAVVRRARALEGAAYATRGSRGAVTIAVNGGRTVGSATCHRCASTRRDFHATLLGSIAGVSMARPASAQGTAARVDGTRLQATADGPAAIRGHARGRHASARLQRARTSRRASRSPHGCRRPASLRPPTSRAT